MSSHEDLKKETTHGIQPSMFLYICVCMSVCVYKQESAMNNLHGLIYH